MKKLLLALSFLAFSLGPVWADSLVVSICGTLPLAYAPGATRLDTVDVNGNKCTGINVTIGALGAGSAIIGKVGIDQTTPGTTNGVQVNAALPTGSNVIGKVSIDQTTPGTTNGVQVNAALPTGSNVIGKVSIDQTTPGATNGVQVNAALPTGSNVIGGVTQGTSPWVTIHSSQYPSGATPLTASATGTTGATTATLAASGSTPKTYICGFSIRANATAAATANSTVTGTVTGTLNYTQWTAPLASGIGLTEQIFTPCIPSSAGNTAVAVISAAPGAGGVVSVTAWGYQL